MSFDERFSVGQEAMTFFFPCLKRPFSVFPMAEVFPQFLVTGFAGSAYRPCSKSLPLRGDKEAKN
ncbi:MULTISPECIES: hypothetical protein [unclassified Roseofilum]|uniref:hypothetical protein n=1 Tax=unclassified Roseofilum TaxID=2620099 RepID=UPI00298E728B|nr:MULTISPECIES: hypothetical protein [unclassified Roseofilum]